MGNILVGTASWTDRTLLVSGWYPEGVKTPQERLDYYARHFRLVEVDSTYYAPASPDTTRLWAERTPPEFTFNIKAFSLLTHHPTRPGALYKDLRAAVEVNRKNIYVQHLDPSVVDEVWKRFLHSLTPLADASRIGVLLFQFPEWFPIGRANKHYILECKRRCEPLRMCVEFRNHTWMEPRNQAETLDFLTSYAIPYVCVDMPQGYPSSIPPVLAATADLAVIRFHGHSDKWTSRDIHERFGYRYREDEISAWAPKLRELADRTAATHVVFNNCYSDYAQTNARQLVDALAA